MTAYMGKKDRFDTAITEFSEGYADQNDRDYQAFVEAIRGGRLAAGNGRSLTRIHRTSLPDQTCVRCSAR